MASVPISSAIGPVSANETGISPATTNQSRLDTRPSISDGTRVCMSAFHMTIPTVFRAKPTKENTNSCQGAPAIANPAVESELSAHATYITVTWRRGAPKRLMSSAAVIPPRPPADMIAPNVAAPPPKSLRIRYGSSTSNGP